MFLCLDIKNSYRTLPEDLSNKPQVPKFGLQMTQQCVQTEGIGIK